VSSDVKLPRLGQGMEAGTIVRGFDFPRQALHAAGLELLHPRSGKAKSWSAPLPADMKKLLGTLRRAVSDAA